MRCWCGVGFAARGQDTPKNQAGGRGFCARLDVLHRELDRAVCDAYGWDHAVLDDDEEILRWLLALNRRGPLLKTLLRR